jgi:hypothetical protein
MGEGLPMSSTPPSDEQAHRDAGDGVELTVDDARQSSRTGRAVWILIISTVLAIVLLGGYWAFRAPGLQGVDAASGGGAHGRRVTDDRAKLFNTMPSSPKPGPPGETSTSGATPSESTPSNSAR